MGHGENGPGGLEGLRVMVIDDSKTIRRTAETLLRREGADVITATDGFEALAKIADQRPQIIFVDIMMPRLDGYQTCALIKNNQIFKSTPVIMLSSKDGLFDKARGRIVGSEQYVTKPFTREELLDAIRTHVHFAENETNCHHLGQCRSKSTQRLTCAQPPACHTAHHSKFSMRSVVSGRCAAGLLSGGLVLRKACQVAPRSS